jgi:hypothetical protein
MSGNLLLIYICNFHVLSRLLLIYICKLHWNLNTMFACSVDRMALGNLSFLLTRSGKLLLIYICNFHVLSNLLHWISAMAFGSGFGIVPTTHGNLLMIYICNFHVLSHLLLIYICKLHWNHIVMTDFGQALLRCWHNFLLIYIWNFHVLYNLLLIYICKLHWNLNTMFVCQVNYFWYTCEISMS